MLAWVQNMGRKRRRAVGDSLGNGRSGAAGDMLPKAITAAVALLLLVAAGMTCQHHFSSAARITAEAAAPDRLQSSRTVRGKPRQPKVYTYSIERQLEHSPEAFTQGLEFDRSCQRNDAGTEECTDVLWESTGMNGESSVREVDLETGAVRRKKMLAHSDFAEGITRLGDRLYQVTWQSSKMFAYKVGNLDEVQELQTTLHDGWGICTDGVSLIVSDSSPTLVWLDPDTLQQQRSVEVHDGDATIPWVNEMEWVNGEIWGNVWQTECIARIDPATGAILGWVMLQGLGRMEQEAHPGHRLDVLNGIAWDGKRRRLFVTGKWWHKLYQVKLRRSNSITIEQARQACIPAMRGLLR